MKTLDPFELEKFELRILINSFKSRGYCYEDVARLFLWAFNEVAQPIYAIHVLEPNEDAEEDDIWEPSFEIRCDTIEEARINIYGMAKERKDGNIAFEIGIVTVNDDYTISDEPTYEYWKVEKRNGSYIPVSNGNTIHPVTGKLKPL